MEPLHLTISLSPDTRQAIERLTETCARLQEDMKAQAKTKGRQRLFDQRPSRYRVHHGCLRYQGRSYTKHDLHRYNGQVLEVKPCPGNKDALHIYDADGHMLGHVNPIEPVPSRPATKRRVVNGRISYQKKTYWSPRMKDYEGQAVCVEPCPSSKGFAVHVWYPDSDERNHAIRNDWGFGLANSPLLDVFFAGDRAADRYPIPQEERSVPEPVVSRRTFWELDSARVGKDEWLTILYDHNSDTVLLERSDPLRPDDDQLIALLRDAFDEHDPPEHCAVMASHDALGKVSGYLTVKGVANVYCGPHLSRCRSKTERVFRDRERKK